jgi:hypothetical protein
MTTGGNGWRGWLNVGPMTPGGGTTGGIGGAASPDGTTVPTTATQDVDNGGAAWTIGGGQAILRNGVRQQAGTGARFWQSSTIYAFGPDSIWYRWTGSGGLSRSAHP